MRRLLEFAREIQRDFGLIATIRSLVTIVVLIFLIIYPFAGYPANLFPEREVADTVGAFSLFGAVLGGIIVYLRKTVQSGDRGVAAWVFWISLVLFVIAAAGLVPFLQIRVPFLGWVAYVLVQLGWGGVFVVALLNSLMVGSLLCWIGFELKKKSGR